MDNDYIITVTDTQGKQILQVLHSRACNTITKQLDIDLVEKINTAVSHHRQVLRRIAENETRIAQLSQENKDLAAYSKWKMPT